MTNRMHDVTDVVLENGVRLVHVKTAQPITCIALMYPCGSRNDPQGKEGLAHLIEHLLMKTTPSFPTVAAARTEYAIRGIQYGATTDVETMDFRYLVNADDAMPALRYFIDVFLSMHVDASRLEGEKSIIAVERNRAHNSSERVVHTGLRECVFAGTSMAHSGLGTSASVAGITHEDVMAFAKRHVVDAPKTFVITSPFEADAFVEELLRLPKCGAAPRREPVAYASLLPERRLRPISGNGNGVQVGIAYKIPCCDRSEEAALDLLTKGYVFAGHASRLHAKLREERHLTYSLAAGLRTFSECSLAWLQFSVAKQNLSEALRICEEEIAALRDGIVDERLLAAAKKGMTFQMRKRSMQPEALAFWYGADAVLGRDVETMDQRCRRYETLSSDDLVRAARNHLSPESRAVVLYGDVQEAEVRLP